MQEIIDVDFDLPSARHARPTSHDIPMLSDERIQQSLHDAAFDLATLAEDLSQDTKRSETVLYLAYGSNMAAKTFQGKRGIKPLSKINVVVPEITLTFDLPGIPYVEPCFANVRYRNGSNGMNPTDSPEPEARPLLDDRRQLDRHKDRWNKGLVGVVYEVTKKDYATIIRTEGGGASYKDVVVTCYALTESHIVPEHPSTKHFRAHTLYAPYESSTLHSTEPGPVKQGGLHRPDPSYAQPSARYLKLLTDGADEHNLPHEYKAFLRNLRPYRITSMRQRLGQVFLVTVWMPIFTIVFRAEKVFADKKGRNPAWLAALFGALFVAVWKSYDVFFKRAFGDGERTIGE